MSRAVAVVPKDYVTLLAEVKERVRAARYQALRAVNQELVNLYWDIGRIVVARQSGKTWGKAVVERLAGDLQQEFPGVGGFSASNLWRMKAFYEACGSAEKLAPLVREIAPIRCHPDFRSSSRHPAARRQTSRNLTVSPLLARFSPRSWSLGSTAGRLRYIQPGGGPVKGASRSSELS